MKAKRNMLVLLILLYLINVVPVCVIGVSSNAFGIGVTRQYIAQVMDGEVRIIAQRFEDAFKALESNLLSCWNNVDIIRLSWGKNSHLSTYERFSAVNGAMEYANSLLTLSDIADDISLYFTDQGWKLDSTNGVFPEMSDFDEELIALCAARRIGLVHYENELYYCVKSSALNSGMAGILVAAHISRPGLEKMLSAYVQDEENEGVLLLNPAINESVSSNMDNTGIAPASLLCARGDVVKGADEDAYLFSTAWTSRGDWMAAKVCRQAALTMNTAWFWAWMICLVSVSCATVVAFTMISKRLIYRPVRSMLEAFERVGQGELVVQKIRFPVNEFDLLHRRFSEMVDRLRGLIDIEYRQKLLLRDAQYKLMQMQINPHFLYNTYYTLSALIADEDLETSRELASLLGTFFQYVTDDPAPESPLYLEVRHAEAYARIQGMRFSHSVKVELMPLPDAMRQIRLPKLSLQPLLENAFEHGIRKSAHGVVRLSYAVTDECFQISVEDSGEPDDARIDWLNGLFARKYVETEGIALKNICQRLYMRYGDKAEMRAARSELGGLMISIILRREENV